MTRRTAAAIMAQNREVSAVLDEKDLQAIREIVKESQSQLIAFIEADVYPRINLAYDGHKLTQEQVAELRMDIARIESRLLHHDAELIDLRLAK